MTSDEFIAAIKVAVHDAAVAGVIETVEQPSGRKPTECIAKLSSWYNALSEADKKNVSTMVTHGVHAALFGLFAVIDGVRVIEDVGEKSEFTLIQKRDGVETPINSPSVLLHDIYQAEVWDEIFGGLAT